LSVSPIRYKKNSKNRSIFDFVKRITNQRVTNYELQIMFKYTTYTLKKIENIFEELEYTIRYAKGNFKSGYCIVETKNVIVVNKFFDTEARINSLLDVLGNVEIDEGKLSEKPLEFYKKLKKKILDPKTAEKEAATEASTTETTSES